MFDIANKHYIRLNGNMIIKGFSDAFEQPLETDICINENGGRHFEINGEINPNLINMDGTHIYKYENNTLRKATKEEIAEELEIMKMLQPETKPSKTIEELEAEVEVLKNTISEMQIALAQLNL